MSYPVDAAVNPQNTDQRYVLWGNGRVDSFNAPPIVGNPEWFDRPDQPVAVAIHIVDWTTGAGYVLDKQGAFHVLNGAPEIGDQGRVIGVPFWDFGIYVDWSWDPNNAGRGVVLDGYGTLHPFGGAPTPPRSANRWNVLVARKLQMDWASMKAYTLDYSGGIHPDYNAGPVAAGAPYWAGQDIARDFVITNWTNGGGYTLDWWGGVHQYGSGVPAAFGGPYRPGGNVARILVVLSETDPARFWQVWTLGQEFEWTASTKPAVVAGGFAPLSPASTVTTTTRPVLSWAYTDAQGDSQTGYEVAVFTAAFVAANNMTDPWVHLWSAVVFETGNDPIRRGIPTPKDLPNGSYHMYVRVKDSAGLWSDWASRAWVQNVPVPVTPTELTAVVNDATHSVALSVTATTGGSADTIRFECSDDNGVTWKGVRGAEAVPLKEVTTAVDYDIPFNVKRRYSARSFNDNPRVISAPSNEVSAVLLAQHFALTSVDDPVLGGRFLVQDPISWSNPTTSGVFEGIGSKYPTVVSDGVPKARRFSIRLVSLHASTWEALSALLHSDSTLVLRDPLGDVIYCRIVGDISASKPKGSSTEWQHNVEIPVVEVAPPIESV